VPPADHATEAIGTEHHVNLPVVLRDPDQVPHRATAKAFRRWC
jgi:hypothetical protein